MHSKLTTVLAVLGAATILVLAANTVAIAANGKGFLLGKVNYASRPTNLTRTVSGPALQVRTKSVANPPLAVNGRGRVANLNADLVDGKDSSLLGTRALSWSVTEDGPTTTYRDYYTGRLAAGTYLVSYEVFLPGVLTDGVILDCYLAQATRYGGEATGTSANSWGAAVSGTALFTLPASAVVRLSCRATASVNWSTDASQPVRITAVPITGLSKGAGSTALRQAARTK